MKESENHSLRSTFRQTGMYTLLNRAGTDEAEQKYARSISPPKARLLAGGLLNLRTTLARTMARTIPGRSC